jgi:F-type H+-transporting ATPase subunit b
MPIDGFTLFAQIANFLILVLLLRRFLFRPVLKAVDEREARMAALRRDAETARAAAEAAKRDWEERRAAQESERRERLGRAEAEAAARKEELLGRYRDEAEAEREKWSRAWEEGRKERAAAWSRLIRREAFALADKALREVADAGLDAACAGRFLRKLEALDAAERVRLAPGAAAAGGFVLRTSFEAGETARAAFSDGLRRILGADARVRFETDSGLGLGVELWAGNHSLSWTVPGALAELEARAEAAMETGRGG